MTRQTDLDALKLAVETARKRDRAKRQQIESMLASRPWHDVAAFAAYSCQVDALQLKPWEWPPIWVNDIETALSEPDDGKRIRSAALLRQRMQRCGVSKWHPDPVAACEAAEQRQTQF